MTEPKLDVARSALLVMDFQTSIVERFPAGQDELLAATAETIAAARRSKMRVMYVVVGFRPGSPEISARNKNFSAIKKSGGLSTDIHPRVAPAADDVIITKHRVGAFLGTDLDMILRANDIETLVLCGISTSGVVLSTLRYAADADYRIVVLRDCCSDSDIEMHTCLLEKVFPRQAAVVNSTEFIQGLA
ncbi:MAG TPA: isochorismatase family cysteine hydrolase [Candidatus Eremiobacteraceae bacterium]